VPTPFADFMNAGVERPIPAPLLQGVLWRRVAAYLVDACVIALLFLVAKILFLPAVIISFGLLASPLALLVAVIPVAYHALLVGGPKSSTWGQRLFGLEMRDVSGSRASFFQAAVQAILFYVTLALTSGLLLLVVFLSPLRRTVHDWLSGMIAVRRYPDGDTAARTRA
jgi:uncharacterized RDD family membrane protein YckC